MSKPLEEGRVLTKESFLPVLSFFLKKEGFALVDSKGVVRRSMEDFWRLYKLIKALEVAVAASSGKPVTLKDISSFEFRMSGRKFKRQMLFVSPSETYRDFFDRRQDLVHYKAPETVEDLIQRVSDLLSHLYYVRVANFPGLSDGANIIEADFELSDNDK